MSDASMLHPGATLRLLRRESNLGLRDLARRIDVSGPYLSRVEHGHDAAPTTERMAALARELGVPATLLLDLSPRIHPLVAEYVERVPAAAAFFLELATRELDAQAIAALRATLDRVAPRRTAASVRVDGRLAPTLDPARVLVGLSCPSLHVAFEFAAARLADATSPSAARLAAMLVHREREVPGALGLGVAVQVVTWSEATTKSMLLTLDPHLRVPAPDDRPVRVLVVLAGAPEDHERRRLILQVARLAARGLAERLAGLDDPHAVLAELASFEALTGL